jgi:hypothetical protein
MNLPSIVKKEHLKCHWEYRYESSLERSFYKAIHELQRVQAMRMGQPVLAPIALDININDINEGGFVSQNESF